MNIDQSVFNKHKVYKHFVYTYDSYSKIESTFNFFAGSYIGIGSRARLLEY